MVIPLIIINIALFGFGIYPGDGMLIDLTGVIPEWSILASTLALTLFFFWFIVFSKQKKSVWAIKPPYATARWDSTAKGIK